MVIPVTDDDDLQNQEKNEEEVNDHAGIMENISNIVDMLGGPSKPEEEKEDQKVARMMENLENPKNVKKSFETKVENDDDDEIFIVHEEEDENQDSLFAEGAFQSFNEDSAEEPVMKKVSSDDNPFMDNLANSVALPQTQKLVIDDNYMSSYQDTEE